MTIMFQYFTNARIKLICDSMIYSTGRFGKINVRHYLTSVQWAFTMETGVQEVQILYKARRNSMTNACDSFELPKSQWLPLLFDLLTT